MNVMHTQKRKIRMIHTAPKIIPLVIKAIQARLRLPSASATIVSLIHEEAARLEITEDELRNADK